MISSNETDAYWMCMPMNRQRQDSKYAAGQSKREPTQAIVDVEEIEQEIEIVLIKTCCCCKRR